MSALFASREQDAPVILIAEDEVLVRFALSDYLADRGFKVLEAGSAAEAIDVLESEPGIDLVFTDIHMPGRLNGIDLARWVHEHRPGLAVVLTSGDVRKTDLAADIRTTEPFFEKPYDLQSVVSQIAVLTAAKAG